MSDKILKLFIVLCILAMALGEAGDFRVYYTAAARWLEAGWPAVYQPDAYTPFKYHPLTLVFFLPWTIVPFAVAKVVWATFNGALLWDSRRRVLALFPAASTSHVLWGFFFAIHAITWQLKFANITFLMLWLLLWAVTDRRTWAGPVGVALLIFFKPTWLVLLPILIWSGARPWFARSLAVLVIASAAVWLVGGNGCYEAWFQTLNDPFHAHNYPKNDNQSWYAFCYRWLEGNTSWTWVLGSAVFTLVFLWQTRQNRRRTDLVLVASAVVWLWASPLSWIHHQILLVPMFTALASIWAPPISTAGNVARILRDPRFLFFAFVWIALDGTGELFMGRAGFVWVSQLRLPLLGLCALLYLLPTYYRAGGGGGTKAQI